MLVTRCERLLTLKLQKGLRKFVRHRLSNYESLLALLRGYEPWLSEELYPKLRSRVDGVVDQAVMQWYGAVSRTDGHKSPFQQHVSSGK